MLALFALPYAHVGHINGSAWFTGLLPVQQVKKILQGFIPWTNGGFIGLNELNIISINDTCYKSKNNFEFASTQKCWIKQINE